MVIPRSLAVVVAISASLVWGGGGLWLGLDPKSRQVWQDLSSGLAGSDLASQTYWQRSHAIAKLLGRQLDQLTHEAPPSRWLRPRWQALLADVTLGNETVYFGRGRFLELRRAIDAVTEPSFLAAGPRDPRPALRQLAADLEARQINLWVLPVPSKVSIHPEAFGASAPLQNVAFTTFCAELEAAGIRVFDPTPLLLERARRQEPTYLQTDSHWHPSAVVALANDLARRLEPSLLPGGRRRDWRRTPRQVEGKGDLLRLLELEGDPRWPTERVEIQVVTDGFGQLFTAERQAEILVLGDSFTNVFSDDSLGWGTSAGLAEQLAVALGRPVDRLAVNGGGALGSRQRLLDELQTGRPRLDGKRVVILQFAARELGLGEWPVLPLAEPKAVSQ